MLTVDYTMLSIALLPSQTRESTVVTLSSGQLILRNGSIARLVRTWSTNENGCATALHISPANVWIANDLISAELGEKARTRNLTTSSSGLATRTGTSSRRRSTI